MAGERLKDALRALRKQYRTATRQERSRLLDELCELSGYHRKYAIALLNRADEQDTDGCRRVRGPTYSSAALRVIEGVWKAAGHPWSVRLKALLPLWLPWARAHLGSISPEVEREVLAISARQIDRRLAPKKRRLKRRLYGRTKPGTLLRRQIPVKVGPGHVAEPGYVEIDLVSHSGPSASGEFVHSLNLTDILLGWSGTRAILGRGEEGVVVGVDDIRGELPFDIQEIHSDNGSEFINQHLLSYCQEHGIRFTRSRPYKKDDNAHIEQKNWTHVRRIFGWDRYDTAEAAGAMSALYAGDLRVMMNLFQPSVKLIERRRAGPRRTRRYDSPRTPLDRLVEFYGDEALPGCVQALLDLRSQTDPFELSESIERQVAQIERRHARNGAPSDNSSTRRPPPAGGGRRGRSSHASR